MSLGRHVHEPAYSFYLQSPSGCAIEYLTGGIETGLDPIFTEFNPEHLSVWGHKAGSPGLPKSVRPVG